MPPSASLRTRWTLALLAAGALPLFLLSLATVRIQRRGLETAERLLEVSVIDHVAETARSSLGEAAEATHRVGLLLTEARVGSDDARLELARDAMAGSELLAQVAIYGADGRFIDAIERSERKDAAASLPPPEPRIAGDTLSAMASGTWQPPRWPAPPSGELEAGSALWRFVEAVRREGPGGPVRAWVVGAVRTAALSPRLEGISRDRFEGRKDGVLLVGGDGRVLAGGSNDPGDPLAVGRSLRSADLFARVELPPGDFNEPFAVATEFTAAGGEAMVGSVRSLPSLHAAVVVRRTERAAYAALASARQLLYLSSALLAVLLVGVGAWLAGRTTRPVLQLVELTRAYARREFGRRSEVRTGDELQQLGDAMTGMAGALADSEKEIARRAAVEGDLSRYLPAEVARSIAEGKASLALGGERREVSVLFADVVAFTTFAEGAPPEKVVAFLNELFTVLTEVVFRHGGTVDKFIGDCVMALFGAPDAQPDHAARALAAAEDMHRFVEAQAPAWRALHGVEVRLGIGVNAGEALVGNLGSERRMEYTAIGDVVNVAARLEGLARPGQTLLTRAVAERAGDGFRFASLGEHGLRGKQQALEVLELS